VHLLLQFAVGRRQVVDLLVQGPLVADLAVTDYPVFLDFDLDLVRGLGLVVGVVEQVAGLVVVAMLVIIQAPYLLHLALPVLEQVVYNLLQAQTKLQMHLIL
jgi:hypothetical protein